MINFETIKTHDIPSVTDLMLIARRSAGFYDAAAKTVENPKLKGLLGDIAVSRTRFLEGAETQMPGIVGNSKSKDVTKVATPDRTVLEWDQFYSAMQPQVSATSGAFVEGVQESEARLLTALDKLAAEKTAPAGLKLAVTNYLPIMRRQHSQVAAREWAKAA